MNKVNYLTRIRIISLCIFAFALLLIGRLYFLQVVDNSVYVDKGDRQYSSTSKNIFNRGNIFFQNKDGTLVSAATLQSGFTIAVNPQILKNPEIAYEKLSALLPTDHDEFIAKATKKNDPYEEIAVRVDTETGQKIADLKIPGLQALKDRWRFYPGGNTAAHIIGILGYKGDEFAGRYGLESEYDGNLKRSDGAYVNFFAQIFSGIKTAAEANSEGEGDVVTTIEPTVQLYLQSLLASTTEKWHSDITGGIVMDPSTGEIVAMEVSPTFDLNNPQAEKDISIFGNPLVQNVYEMGSIIKPLTVAAGIDAGVITAQTTYNDTGSVKVGDKIISNFDGKARGPKATMQELLSYSLNVGAVFVESRLGDEQFTKYMYDFGVNQKTGIELPGEGRNLVKNLESPRTLEHANAAFGQGIALTPISTVRALATIANGGILVSPHVVKRIDYKIGVSKDTPINTSTRVLKKETTEEVARMMTYTVDNILSNGKLKNPHYSVAAKTGTAQVAKENGGGYYDDKHLHSFVGFFPSYNPRFIIFLYTLDPKGAQFGSETLTSPFMSMVNFLINYYEVPPDR